MTIIEPTTGCPACRCWEDGTGSPEAAAEGGSGTGGDSGSGAASAIGSQVVAGMAAGVALVCLIALVAVIAVVKRRQAAALGRRTGFEWDSTAAQPTSPVMQQPTSSSRPMSPPPTHAEESA